MFKLLSLYSEPETFKPIRFRGGLNLILGETKEGNIKTNGVGKSLAVEFINFALLKKLSESRISLIPKEDFDPETKVCLEFSFNGWNYTIKRSVINQHHPELYHRDKQIVFSSLDDATEYFTNEFIANNEGDAPSFRAMLGPLIRDERSEFKSLVLCHDTNKRIPADYAPHLFLLDIDTRPYKQIKKLWTDLDNLRSAAAKVKENVETLTGKNFTEAKAELNELTNQVNKIQDEIDSLENVKGYDILKDEIIGIEHQLDELRARQATLKHESSKIKIFGRDVYVANDEVEELYNQFREGLGDYIQKQLVEVISFKQKIDDFQTSLLESKQDQLLEELASIDKKIALLDQQYKERINILDQTGLLKNLKQTIAIQHKKMEELSSLSAWMKTYAKLEFDKTTTSADKNQKTLELKLSLMEAASTLDSLQKTILDIHEYVAGNCHCSFDVAVLPTKEVLRFDLRIHDDGSHSNEREKVFMYDIALLLNSSVAARHPGFLVHDNIFDVDQDTLVKSLNYLHSKQKDLSNKQYILTINSDKFRPTDIERLHWEIPSVTVASFTKHEKFLNSNYQEIGKKK